MNKRSLGKRFGQFLVILFLIILVLKWSFVFLFKITETSGSFGLLLLGDGVLLISFVVIGLFFHQWAASPLIHLNRYLKNISSSTGRDFENASDSKSKTDYSQISLDWASTFKSARFIRNIYQNTFKNLHSLALETRASQKELAISFKSAMEAIEEIRTSSTSFQTKLKDELVNLHESHTYFEHIVTSIEEVMTRVDSNSKAVEKSISAVEKVFETFDQVNEHISRANSITTELDEIANTSEKSVFNTANAMEEINQSSIKVTDIIKIIYNISEKTKILSLNASIEAANAGEIGRGFAVVAGEIRKLASNTGESISKIKDLVTAMNDKTENGVVIARNASEAIHNIHVNIHQNTDTFKEVFNAIKTQESVIMEVAEDLNSIIEITTELKSFNENQRQNIDKLISVSNLISKVLPDFEFILGEYGVKMRMVEQYLEDVKINIQLNRLLENEISHLIEELDSSDIDNDDPTNLVPWLADDAKPTKSKSNSKLNSFHIDVTYNDLVIAQSSPLLDISLEGLTCLTPKSFDQTKSYSLTINPLGSEYISVPLTIFAKVVSVVPAGKEKGYQARFAFLPLTDEQRRYLSTFA